MKIDVADHGPSVIDRERLTRDFVLFPRALQQGMRQLDSQ